MKTYKWHPDLLWPPKWLRCSFREKVALMAHGRNFIKMSLWTFLSVSNSLNTKISPPTFICFSVCFAKVPACHLLYLHSAKNPGEKKQIQLVFLNTQMFDTTCICHLHNSLSCLVSLLANKEYDPLCRSLSICETKKLHSTVYKLYISFKLSEMLIYESGCRKYQMQLFSFICNVSINKSKWPFQILPNITGYISTSSIPDIKGYISTSSFYIINKDTENIDLECFLNCCNTMSWPKVTYRWNSLMS